MKIFTFLALTTLALFCACAKKNQTSAAPSKPIVLVSIAPYQMFVERIAKGLVDVRAIVPQGANAHSYEPTPRQVESIRESSLWFRIGEPFETPLLKLFEAPQKIIDLREGVDLIHTHEMSCSHCHMDHQDRHIWMSPKQAKTQAAAIAEMLKELLPEHTAAFEENLQALLCDLEALDAEIRQALSRVKDGVILVSHPAFGYFCRDYELEQLSVEYEGKDPRPRQLEAILRKAISHRPEAAIALPQHNNKGAQMLAEELRLPIKLIDPYSPDYFETMRALAEWIATPCRP